MASTTNKSKNKKNSGYVYYAIFFFVAVALSVIIFYHYNSSNTVTLNACTSVLKYGEKNSDVQLLQKQLNLHKKDIGGTLNVDGDYGYLTEAAVKNYQNDHKIPVTGIVDWNTWRVLLNTSTCKVQI